MFIAREAGPELVGNINGRTAVANNDQIVAAVSQGVYSAVVAAMSQGAQGGEQAINVYLDGKQIYASVKKTEKERGATLMTGGMAYGY
jgi:GMP synthase PP-ATPase subunit